MRMLTIGNAPSQDPPAGAAVHTDQNAGAFAGADANEADRNVKDVMVGLEDTAGANIRGGADS